MVVVRHLLYDRTAMGSFFSNIHVLCGGDGAAAVRERIREAILSGPYEESGESAPADRTVIIARTASPRALVICDEDADAPDLGELERLAAVASTAGHAIAASVTDSDVLHLALFARGECIERLTFNPANRRHRRPKHAEWLRLLSADQLGSFQGSFESGVAFAERPLERLAELLGLDADFVFLGYRYRDEMPEGPRESLRFRLRPEARFYTPVEEPPDLSWSLEEKKTARLATGETTHVHIKFLNQGGEGKGLIVAIPWSPDSEQSVRIESLRITCADACQELDITPLAAVAGTGRAIRGSARELRFYPWIRWSPDVTAAQLSKISEIINRHTMNLDITIAGVAPGKVEFPVILMPAANAREGAGVTSCRVEVAERR